MSVFYCEAHQREEDSDAVGCVEVDDGKMVCDEAQGEAEYTRADAQADRADEANDEAEVERWMRSLGGHGD